MGSMLWGGRSKKLGRVLACRVPVREVEKRFGIAPLSYRTATLEEGYREFLVQKEKTLAQARTFVFFSSLKL